MSGHNYGCNRRFVIEKNIEGGEGYTVTPVSYTHLQNILNRFIAEGRATLRAFALTTRTNFNDKEATSIYYGIMAVACKMKLNLGTKEGITSAVNNFLSGCLLYTSRCV